MKISLQAEGLLRPQQFAAWSAERRRAIHQAVARAMRAEARPLQEAAQAAMERAFQVRKRGFVKSMRTKVLDRRRDRLPALLIGSRIPWLGIHVTGGTIAGPKRMLIPLLPAHQRIGRKAFRRVIDGLMASGNAYFIRKDDRVILMAEAIGENSRELTRFKRAERLRSGAKSIKRGQEIPIAVLVPTVRMRRRLDLEGVVRPRLPRIAAAVTRELSRLKS